MIWTGMCWIIDCQIRYWMKYSIPNSIPDLDSRHLSIGPIAKYVHVLDSGACVPLQLLPIGTKATMRNYTRSFRWQQRMSDHNCGMYRVWTPVHTPTQAGSGGGRSWRSMFLVWLEIATRNSWPQQHDWRHRPTGDLSDQ